MEAVRAPHTTTDYPERPPTGPLTGPELLEALADPPGTSGPPDAPEAVRGARASSMAVTLVAYRDDGTELVVATDARDHRGYATLRARYDLPASPGLGGPDGLLLLTFAAWHAARYRHRLTTEDWPEWNAHTIAVDMEVDQETADPFSPDRGGG